MPSGDFVPDAADHEEQCGSARAGFLVALLMGSKLAGVIGAMIAVPTAVLVSVLIQEYLVQHDDEDRRRPGAMSRSKRVPDLRTYAQTGRRRACLLS